MEKIEELNILPGTRLLYSTGLKKENGVEICIDVKTWEDVYLYPYRNSEENFIILVGPLLESDPRAYGEPGIAFGNIHCSFVELINAGLSKEAAITKLLLFYGATPLLEKSSEAYGKYQAYKYIILSREKQREEQESQENKGSEL
jgi:hypothetical protein